MKRAENGLRIFGNLGQIWRNKYAMRFRRYNVTLRLYLIFTRYHRLLDRFILLDLFKNGLYNYGEIRGRTYRARFGFGSSLTARLPGLSTRGNHLKKSLSFSFTALKSSLTPLALFCCCALCMQALAGAFWWQCRLFAKNRARLGAVVALGVRL